MAIRTYQLALSATPKRLSDVYGGAPGVIDARTDVAYRQIGLTVEGADAYFGMDNTVSSSNWGAKGAIAVGPPATVATGSIGSFDSGPVKLSDIWAVGAGATVHIWGVPF